MNKTSFWKKLDFAFWVLVLLAISAGAGVTTVLVQQPLMPRSEYIPMFIIMTLVTILLVGIIAFFVYRYLKSHHSDVALKRAMQVYGIVVTGMLIYGSVNFEKSLAIRDKHEYLEFFKPRFEQIIAEKLERDYPDKTITKEQVEDLADFCYLYFEMDDDFYMRLKTAKDKREFVLNDKTIDENVKTAMESKK